MLKGKHKEIFLLGKQMSGSKYILINLNLSRRPNNQDRFVKKQIAFLKHTVPVKKKKIT